MRLELDSIRNHFLKNIIHFRYSFIQQVLLDTYYMPMNWLRLGFSEGNKMVTLSNLSNREECKITYINNIREVYVEVVQCQCGGSAVIRIPCTSSVFPSHHSVTLLPFKFTSSSSMGSGSSYISLLRFPWHNITDWVA